MRKTGVSVVAGLVLAGVFSVSTAGPAVARSSKDPHKTLPQIVSITATRTATELGIVVRTTAVPSTYRVTERIYFLSVSGSVLSQCGSIMPLWSGAGTGTSSTQPYAAPLPAGAVSVRVEADLSQIRAKRTAVTVDSVDSGPVAIPALPPGANTIGMNIWVG